MSHIRTYNVEGMHCASCVSLIEKKLGKVPGVTSASAKLAGEKVVVEFSESEVALETLDAAVSPFGYTLHIIEAAKDQSHGHDHAAMAERDMALEMKFVLPMVVFSFAMMVWEVLVEWGKVAPLSFDVREVFHHLLPVFASFVLFGIGRKYIKAVWVFLKTRTANMDTLVGISTIVAFVYSLVVTSLEGPLAPYINIDVVYYDVVIIVIGLIAFGQYLETRAKQKTNASLEKLANLVSKTALVVRGGVEVSVPVAEVQIGEVIIVKPHERIPLDGVITTGLSSIDESNLTGEALPVDKGVGDIVFAGTQNFQGILYCTVTKDPKDTALAHIIEIVEAAQNSKAPIEHIADKIAGVFVYVVLGVAILTFISWLVFAPATMGLTLAFAYALSTTMAVLVIACPCSLGLATPTAIITGVGRGAERGILIKNAESLEKLARVMAVVFDKTGTLTENKLTVVGMYAPQGNLVDVTIQSIMYAITKSSKHPVSESVAAWFASEQVTPVAISNIKEVAGKGVSASFKNETYYLGSLAFITEVLGQTGVTIIGQFAGTNQTGGRALYMASSLSVLAVMYVQDTLKVEVRGEIAKLQKLGLRVVMATGDLAATGTSVGTLLGIDEVHTEVTPSGKLDIIRALQKQGLTVAMVGDGVNDAPALAAADVAISMSNGSDIAIESADIVLLRGDIAKVAEAVHLAQRTNRTIWQNLIWSFGYNSVGIPIAAGILFPFFGWTLSPAIAGAIMAFESITVVTNSLRIKTMKL